MQSENFNNKSKYFCSIIFIYILTYKKVVRKGTKLFLDIFFLEYVLYIFALCFISTHFSSYNTMKN